MWPTIIAMTVKNVVKILVVVILMAVVLNQTERV
jgi:hypothetical protein